MQRVFLAEKWLVARLHYGHVDPREAGVGNIVNCGAAMYMAPVGIVNAGDPAGAYAEAIDVAGAHQSSYGREAAGVFAAAVAEAMRPGASIVDRGRRGGAVWPTTARGRRSKPSPTRRRATTSGRPALGALREAVAPVRHRRARLPVTGARRPPTESYQGDRGAAGRPRPGARHRRRLHRVRARRACNYGRDADSIATMAGAVTGALGGMAAVPERWRTTVVGGEPDRHRRAGAHDGRGRPARSGPTTLAPPPPAMRRDRRCSPIDDPPQLVAAGGPPPPRARRRRARRRRRRRPARALDRGRRSRRGERRRGVARRRRARAARAGGSTAGPRRRARGAGRACASASPTTSPPSPRSPPGLLPVSTRGVARSAPRCLARSGRRVPARQAGGEDRTTRHPGDRPLDGELADRPRTSPPSGSTRRSPRRTPGTDAAPRTAWPRTSTGCPRTTT